MYKCDFFYTKNESPNTSTPHILSCWNILTDGNYSYTRQESDKEFYPDETVAFIHCLDGEGEIVTVTGSILLKQGDFIAIYLREIISYRSRSPIWEYFWVDFLYDAFPNSGKIYNYLVSDFERELFTELHQAGSDEEQMTFYINAMYYHYLARVLHFRAKPTMKNSHTISKEEICNYIDQKYMMPLKMTDIATFFNVTTRRINQIFHVVGEQTPKQYILLTKINKAKNLLKNTSVNISEISDMLSFSSPFHFTKTFKQYVGTTPSAFRAR